MILLTLHYLSPQERMTSIFFLDYNNDILLNIPMNVNYICNQGVIQAGACMPPPKITKHRLSSAY